MELGAIGELVGAIAVIASLLYLAAQVRHGNEIAEEGASQQWTELNFVLAGGPATDRHLAEVWVQAGHDFAALDAVDQQRMVLFEWRAIEAWHHAFHQQKRGRMPAHQWNKIVWPIQGPIGEREGFRQAWNTFRESYDADFQALLDGHMSEG